MHESMDIEEVNKRLETFTQEYEKVRFLTRDNAERIQQSKTFGELVTEIERIVATITRLLRMPKQGVSRWQSAFFRLTRQRQYDGRYHDHLRIQLINAALLELQLRLLIIRAIAHRTWLEQSTEAPHRRKEVQNATRVFKARIRHAAVRPNALNTHTIAAAFRSWSDELSIPATTISGWLETAIPVARDLRYIANQYEARWRWKSLFDNQFPASIPERINTTFLAILHTSLGVLAGYGLKTHRFVISLLAIITTFAGAYLAIDIAVGCNRAALDVNYILQYLAFSIQFLLGDQPQNPAQPATDTCKMGFDYIGVVGVAETAIGYLMLGILVSLLWTAIQRRSIDTSKIGLPEHDGFPE